MKHPFWNCFIIKMLSTKTYFHTWSTIILNLLEYFSNSESIILLDKEILDKSNYEDTNGERQSTFSKHTFPVLASSFPIKYWLTRVERIKAQYFNQALIDNWHHRIKAQVKFIPQLLDFMLRFKSSLIYVDLLYWFLNKW